MNGAELIAAERVRQKSEEGWGSRHDDEHTNGELVAAAVAYALRASILWPWPSDFWKPTTRIRDLTKAGALIAAEIDRLLREEVKP